MKSQFERKKLNSRQSQSKTVIKAISEKNPTIDHKGENI